MAVASAGPYGNNLHLTPDRPDALPDAQSTKAYTSMHHKAIPAQGHTQRKDIKNMQFYTVPPTAHLCIYSPSNHVNVHKCTVPRWCHKANSLRIISLCKLLIYKWSLIYDQHSVNKRQAHIFYRWPTLSANSYWAKVCKPYHYHHYTI